MEKQIIYCRYMPRLFATTIDLFLLAFIVNPLMQVVAHYSSLAVFKEFFNQHLESNYSSVSIMMGMSNPNSAIYFTSDKILTYCTILILSFAIMVGSFFISFWKYKGATPGKMLMNMKIVDADTLGNPTTRQLILRFLWAIIMPLGIWLIRFSKKNQALHDRMANTVVIKS